MTKRKRTKGQSIIYKTLHRKLKIEQHEPHKKCGVKSDAPVALTVPAPLVAPIVLILLRVLSRLVSHELQNEVKINVIIDTFNTPY